MELLGFFYEKSEDKIAANGFPIPRNLLKDGYVQKDDSDGNPVWYVKPSKVWVSVEINGIRKKFNIYNNIMALYPERQRMTLKLAQDVIALIIAGKIELALRNGNLFLVKVPLREKKKR